FEALLSTLASLLQAHPKAQVLTCYHERSGNRCIEPLLERWALAAKYVPMAFADPSGAPLCAHQPTHASEHELVCGGDVCAAHPALALLWITRRLSRANDRQPN
ncbi:hypothetical protein H4R35_005003, partial [Dimargaris xerosporica]